MAPGWFQPPVRIIPYLVAMLLAIALLRASGALEMAIGAIRSLVKAMLVLMRAGRWPADRHHETLFMAAHKGDDADSMQQTRCRLVLCGRLVSVIQGSSETTFYVAAVYFGSVGIKHCPHAAGCGLFADVVGFAAAVAVSYLFFA